MEVEKDAAVGTSVAAVVGTSVAAAVAAASVAVVAVASVASVAAVASAVAASDLERRSKKHSELLLCHHCSGLVEPWTRAQQQLATILTST